MTRPPVNWPPLTQKLARTGTAAQWVAQQANRNALLVNATIIISGRCDHASVDRLRAAFNSVDVMSVNDYSNIQTDAPHLSPKEADRSMEQSYFSRPSGEITNDHILSWAEHATHWALPLVVRANMREGLLAGLLSTVAEPESNMSCVVLGSSSHASETQVFLWHRMINVPRHIGNFVRGDMNLRTEFLSYMLEKGRVEAVPFLSNIAERPRGVFRINGVLADAAWCADQIEQKSYAYQALSEERQIDAWIDALNNNSP